MCLGIVLQGAGYCKSERTVRYCLNAVRSLCCCLDNVLSARTRGKVNSKGRKKGYDEYGIVLILEQNIRVFLGLHKLTHGLTFGIIYFYKYYGQ